MKDKEKQIEEILKLDILDCVGIKLAYLDDMRISKSKPLSVMKNMLSIDCRKDYILEALGITEDSVVLSKEEFWKLSNKFSKKELDEIVEFHKNKERKETAEKFAKMVYEKLSKFYQYDLDWKIPNDEIKALLDELAKQFGVEIKE